MIINDNQMTCIICGHIAEEDAPYELEEGYEEEDEHPICPTCGNSNICGYPNYVDWGLWGEDDREKIIYINGD